MKKISSGYHLVQHIFTQKDKGNYSVHALKVLRDVNQLLKQHNLEIRFKDSIHWTDDFIFKNEDEIKKDRLELSTEIELYQIEEDK